MYCNLHFIYSTHTCDYYAIVLWTCGLCLSAVSSLKLCMHDIYNLSDIGFCINDDVLLCLTDIV